MSACEQVLERPPARSGASRGTPTALSLDARAAGRAGGRAGPRHDGNRRAKGAAVVLDADSGEVVALASLPSFNPNLVRSCRQRSGCSTACRTRSTSLAPPSSRSRLPRRSMPGCVTDHVARAILRCPFNIGGYTIPRQPQLRRLAQCAGSADPLLEHRHRACGRSAGRARRRQAMEALGMNERPHDRTARARLPALAACGQDGRAIGAAHAR